MAYFTEGELRNYASSLKYASTSFANVKSMRSLAQVTIFLSHSHKDRELAQGLVLYLGSLGTTVYVDWNDSDMPRITNRDTAERIKGKIKDNKLFLVLATRNALDSKWVPWETGVADQCKGEQVVLLIPVADSSGRFEGSEYLQLYRHVESATFGGYAVFPPGEVSGKGLREYITLYG